MKIRIGSIAVLASAMLFASAASAGGVPAATAVSAGATNYVAKCASCHGKDGKGQTTIGKKMALRALGAPAVQKQTDQQLIDITAKGKKKMPAYEKKLTALQIKEIVAHIRTMASK